MTSQPVYDIFAKNTNKNKDATLPAIHPTHRVFQQPRRDSRPSFLLTALSEWICPRLDPHMHCSQNPPALSPSLVTSLSKQSCLTQGLYYLNRACPCRRASGDSHLPPPGPHLSTHTDPHTLGSHTMMWAQGIRGPLPAPQGPGQRSTLDLELDAVSRA